MKKEGFGDRTCHNRCAEVRTMLRFHGIDVSIRVKYTEKIVRAYRDDELQKLFAVADPEEHLLFSFFLATGAREQEIQYATWGDVDLEDGIFTVRDHPEFGFVPKDREMREIPLPAELVKRQGTGGYQQPNLPEERQTKRPYAAHAESYGEAGDIARSDKRTRALVTRQIRENIELLATLLREANGNDRGGARAQAILGYGALVGALSVARAVSDDQLSREILKTVAQFLKDPLLKATSATAHR